jgi:hypothetical protein
MLKRNLRQARNWALLTRPRGAHRTLPAQAIRKQADWGEIRTDGQRYGHAASAAGASSASIRGVAPVLARIFSFVRSRPGCRRRTAVLVAADLSAVPRTASPHFADRSEILDPAFNSNRDALIWPWRNGCRLVFGMAAVCPM